MSSLDRTATVARIVLDHPECAKVFSDHGIDYCCHGNRSLDEACGTKLDVASVVAKLETAIAARAGEAQPDPRTRSTPELLGFIVSTHHAYLREALPFLEPLAAKVARVHGDHEPRLRELLEVFLQLRAALEPHLDQEEQVLFPALSMRDASRALIDRELAAMHADHLLVGAMLGSLRELSDGYTPPSWACNSYRALLSELAALEADILRHVHLENHVLMPRFAAASPAGATA